MTQLPILADPIIPIRRRERDVQRSAVTARLLLDHIETEGDSFLSHSVIDAATGDAFPALYLESVSNGIARYSLVLRIPKGAPVCHPRDGLLEPILPWIGIGQFDDSESSTQYRLAWLYDCLGEYGLLPNQIYIRVMKAIKELVEVAGFFTTRPLDTDTPQQLGEGGTFFKLATTDLEQQLAAIPSFIAQTRSIFIHYNYRPAV